MDTSVWIYNWQIYPSPAAPRSLPQLLTLVSYLEGSYAEGHILIFLKEDSWISYATWLPVLTQCSPCDRVSAKPIICIPSFIPHKILWRWCHYFSLCKDKGTKKKWFFQTYKSLTVKESSIWSYLAWHGSSHSQPFLHGSARQPPSNSSPTPIWSHSMLPNYWYCSCYSPSCNIQLMFTW